MVGMAEDDRGRFGNGPALRFAGYRLRRTLRSRVGGYLTTVLLIGLIGGIAMGAVAGARRTQSAFSTYLTASQASDMSANLLFPAGASLGANLYSPKVTAQLEHLPHVRAVSAFLNSFVAPLGRNGRPALPGPLLTNEVATVVVENGEYFTTDRMVADEGRAPDPRRVDEVAITAEAAHLLGWRVGETIPMGAYGFDQVGSVADPSQFGPPRFTIDAKVTGVVAFSSNVVDDQVDRLPTFVLFTPAFSQKMVSIGGAGFATYSLRLDHGARDVPSVEREIIAAVPPGTVYSFHVTSVTVGQVERATKPVSIALGAFGALAGLAALLIAGQALSRVIRRDAPDLTALRAIGASPKMIVADVLLGTLGAVVLGALVAMAVCVALSPIAPLGTVRDVDPSPGLSFDWTVLGIGFGLFVVGLAGFTLVLVLITTRARTGADTASMSPSTSRVVASAVRLGLPPAPVSGIRYAVERGRGRDAVPVASALGGAVVAIAVIATTLTFGSGLATLVSRPALYGWNWDDIISVPGGGKVPPYTQNLLNHDPDVAAWTGFSFGQAQIDRETVPIMILPRGAKVVPPVIAGDRVIGAHDIDLGGNTLAQLHKHVGDTVVVTYGSPKNAPIYVPPTTLRIVGTATLPALGNPDVLHPSMGFGAVISEGIEPAAMVAAQQSPDPNQNGPDVVAIRFRSGVNRAGALLSLQHIASASTQHIAQDPNAGGTFEVLPVQQPAEIVNYRTMGSTPAILAASVAAGAVVALGLTLVASVRRRRRDLALLKTLGFAQRQMAAVVAWQASVAALVGVVVGLPLGVAVGRGLWDLFAHAIYVVPSPSVPFVELALVAIGALVLANAVSYWPGRLAARTKTAFLLRSE